MENFDSLKKTPLFERHIELGGKIVDFGGWALPVQYSSILDECKAVRERCGLFDVSHMGEVDIYGNDAYAYVQKMVTNDVTTMTPGRCRYAVMCYENGGAVDDVLIYKFADDHYMFIVNAGNTDKDFAWMKEHVFGDVRVENNSAKWGQLALQGPDHQKVLDAAGFEGEIPEKYYTFNDKMIVAGVPCLVSRTGYTGEDGVELYCAAEDTVRLHKALMEAGKCVDMLPCGLGARDTLRFEASMPLYGHEMNENINPMECGLGFAIKLKKDYFIGIEALRAPQTRKRIGLKLVGKGVARPESEVLCNGEVVGVVTSGGPAPAVGGNYVMCLVNADSDEAGKWAVSVRGREIECEFSPMPFYKRK
ncbi:MAG: glycine cleavage system aminomethyltransferase GcvT [Clostridia bacterium]|nr:glycine cleavage system aminomethyltransferase GcvT [Clostridia bacterium]